MTNPKWWSFTIPRTEYLKDGRPNPYYGFSTRELGEQFTRHGAESWVIGEEVGEDGYPHWQAKIKFGKGQTEAGLLKLWPCCWFAPSATHNYDYEEKQGKYVRSWETAISQFADIPLLAWQKELLAKVDYWNTDRKIFCIVDYYGNSGKTTLAKHLVASHQGAYCPELPEALDYMAWALAHSNAKTFVLDLPKGLDWDKKPEKEREMWKAVEQMKNGYLYDKRHEWKEKWIDPPRIIVIMNDDPAMYMLSADRWVIGHLEGDKPKNKYIVWKDQEERRRGGGTQSGSAERVTTALLLFLVTWDLWDRK